MEFIKRRKDLEKSSNLREQVDSHNYNALFIRSSGSRAKHTENGNGFIVKIERRR